LAATDDQRGQMTPDRHRTDHRRFLLTLFLMVAGLLLPLQYMGTSYADDRHSGDLSEFECICGPDDVPAELRGCVPLFRYAITRSFNREGVIVYISDRNDPQHFTRISASLRRCTEHNFYLPAPTHITLRSVTPAVKRVCEAQRRETHRREVQETGNPHDEAIIDWHIVRRFGLTPYHVLYDGGALQMWLATAMLREHLKSVRHNPSLTIRLRVNNFYDTLRRDEWASMHDLRGHMLHPVQELFMMSVGAERYDIHKPGFRCAEYQVFGTPNITPMSFEVNYTKTAFPSFPVLQKMATELNGKLLARFGEAPSFSWKTGLIDQRKTEDYDQQNRSRGIQPALEHEITRALAEHCHIDLVPFHLGSNMTLQEQFHLVRSHRLIVGGEGALFAMMIMSAPNTTWVQVYNHTRRRGTWLHSNFHAAVARGIPWVRLVILVISNKDHYAPVHELIRAIERGGGFNGATPFLPGVVYVGVDEFGREMTASEVVANGG
jgi:hypothetical protein